VSPALEASKETLVEASLKFIHMAPMKLRRVVNEIRGKQVDEALTILNFAPQRASKIIEKLLKSAIEKFGPRKQLVQALEELSELQKAICKILRYESENDLKKLARAKDELQDEIIDVEIMLAQLKMMFPIDEKDYKKLKGMKLDKLESYL
jgi:hypothetical protein